MILGIRCGGWGEGAQSYILDEYLIKNETQMANLNMCLCLGDRTEFDEQTEVCVCVFAAVCLAEFLAASEGESNFF